MAARTALQIFDIVDEIFKYELNAQSLARAARVCRAFTDPALDALWKEMVSPIPLLRLFSSFQIVPGEMIIFDGCSVSDNEWTRFRLYAGRVRHLRIYAAHWMQVPSSERDAVLDTLYRLNGSTPLCPRLTTLTWQQGATDETTGFPFVTPTLVHFTFQRDPMRLNDSHMRSEDLEFTSEDAALSGVLQDVFSRAPLLRRVYLVAIRHPQVLLSVVHCKNIEQLCIYGALRLDLSLLQGLGSLPEPVQLHLIECTSVACEDAVDGFPTLWKPILNMGVGQTLSILSSIQAQSIGGLDICLSSIGSLDILRALLHLVGASFPFLLTFWICCEDFSNPWTWPTGAILDIYRPLLSLRALIIVAREFPRDARSLAHDLVRLTAAWPEAEVLSFRCYITPAGQPLPARVLVDISRQCPKLRRITLPCLDFGDTLPLPGDTAATRHGLQELEAHCATSPVENPVEVARFLDAVFPDVLVPVRSHANGQREPGDEVLEMWANMQAERAEKA